jgi:hypothetical protein
MNLSVEHPVALERNATWFETIPLVAVMVAPLNAPSDEPPRPLYVSATVVVEFVMLVTLSLVAPLVSLSDSVIGS